MVRKIWIFISAYRIVFLFIFFSDTRNIFNISGKIWIFSFSGKIGFFQESDFLFIFVEKLKTFYILHFLFHLATKRHS